MTNEEIRNNNNKDYKYWESEVNQIQDLTRADEREKVIGEIEKVVEDCFGDSAYYKLLKYEFTTKLNSLREAK